jgi:phosphoribosylaminoimidazole-succinocarboxamide synthase
MYKLTELEKLYAGKTKDVYRLTNGNILLQFTNKTTMNDEGVEDPGGNNVGKEVAGSARACVLMTQHFFKLFEEAGIPTHLIAVDVENLQMEVKPVTTIGKELFVNETGGIEWIWRNRITGSFFKNFGRYNKNIKDGDVLSSPIVHATVKDDGAGDPYIEKDFMDALCVLSGNDYEILKEYTKKAGKILYEEFLKLGCEIWDFKIEFGRDKNGTLILIDEIGPGSARVYKDGKKMEKIHIGDLFV